MKKAETSSSTSTDVYYSTSPESQSAKMQTYIHFMKAAHDGDAEIANEVTTDDITWDFMPGSEVANGLPWIGLFKGKKAIFEMVQPMKELELEVLSRKYDFLLETETQLIMMVTDTIKLKGMVLPNVSGVNVITFHGDKIAYIKSVEDGTRVLIAYQAYQANQAIKAWSK